MSKPKDPVLAVIAYFETADLALVRQTLAIVQQIVKRRLPAGRATPGPKKASAPAARPRAATPPAAMAADAP